MSASSPTTCDERGRRLPGRRRHAGEGDRGRRPGPRQAQPQGCDAGAGRRRPAAPVGGTERRPARRFLSAEPGHVVRRRFGTARGRRRMRNLRLSWAASPTRSAIRCRRSGSTWSCSPRTSSSTDPESPTKQRDRRAKAKIDLVRQECDRLQKLLGDFLDFARQETLTLEPGSLNAEIEQLLDFFAPAGPRGGRRDRPLSRPRTARPSGSTGRRSARPC